MPSIIKYKQWSNFRRNALLRVFISLASFLLELYRRFFLRGSWGLVNYLPKLALNHNPPDLSLESS
jgi:hypothetical protein